MSNLGLRLLSLIIAVLLSIFVNSENNITSAKIIVGVEVRDLPSDKIIIWQLKKEVEVEIRGPSFLVSRLSATPPTLRIKLPEEVGTKFSAQINRSDLNIEAPVQIVSIMPSSISFTVENKVAKELPIKISKVGQLSTDVRLFDIVPVPSTVSVIGPESEVKDLQSIVAPVDLRDIRGSGNIELPLRNPGKQTELSFGTVKGQVTASMLDVPRTFDSVPVELRMSAHDGFRVTPETVSVNVIGTKEIIQELKSTSIIPYVRVTSESIGTSEELPVQVEVPQGVTVVSVTPKSVHILNESIKRKGK